MTSTADADSAPVRAFEDLRAEVSLLRRAIEGLTAEREAAPDYTPTLAEMSQRLDAMVGWVRKVADTPALQLTPESLARQITEAGSSVRADDRTMIQAASARLDGWAGLLDGLVRRDRSAHEQRRWLERTAAVAFLLGMLLWSFLPGVLARALPARWHVPERLAARMLGAERRSSREPLAMVQPQAEPSGSQR